MERKCIIEPVKHRIEEFIEVNEIEFIGCGQDSDAFCVNNEYVFKFPKSLKAGRGIDNEIRLLKRIQGRFDLEIPCVLFEGSIQGLTFFGSKKLKGKSLTKEEFLRLPEKDDIAEKLAVFLKKLHVLDSTGRKDMGRLHGDFSLNHVLFENGKVSGILDFADTRIGRVKSGFIYLLDDEDEEEFGRDFGLKVLEKYNGYVSGVKYWNY